MQTHEGNSVSFTLRLVAMLFGSFLMQSVEAASFVTNSALNFKREFHTATLLPDEKVLIAGGFNNVNGMLSSAELYDPATGTNTPTNPLINRRAHHTATLLPNGRVLVVGGSAPGGYLASAELYDPASGTWAATGALATNRAHHTATLLPNGKVLVAGGSFFWGGTWVYLSSAELYDPATESWTATGTMTTARERPTATSLPNGMVLVAGGFATNGTLSSAELYDPATEIWTATGGLSNARRWHTATLLPNGKVLVAGGGSNSTFPPTSLANVAELYDPATELWTQTDDLTTARAYHTATLLPSGMLLVVGGVRVGNTSVAAAELYDFATETWTTNGVLTHSRYGHTAVVLPNGNVLVAGGVNQPNSSTSSYLASTEVYHWANGSWTNTGALNTARYLHTATFLPTGQVLVAAGGFGSTGVTNSAELYDPVGGTWTNANPLSAARSAHTATLLPDGMVLVAGGYDYVNGNYSYPSNAEKYDAVSGMWTGAGTLNTARMQHAATLLANGMVLVTGGQGGLGVGYLASAELYDLNTESWTRTGTMLAARYNHTATLLPNGNVLVAGGDGGSYLAGAELYNPAIGKWTATSTMFTARRQHTATLLPTGKVLVAGGQGNLGYLASAELYNPATGGWTTTSPMTTARSVHTATLLPNGTVLVTGGYSGGGPRSSAELYDPATGKWTTNGPMTIAHASHTATLLPDGKLLIAAGVNLAFSTIASSELYDVGLDYANSWQPQVAAITSPLSLGSSFVVTGSQFRGISGASGGNTQDSSSDYPLVQLRSIESGQSMFLLTTNWSTNSFTSLPVWNFQPGYALATVFVNGIPSTSSIVNVSVPIPAVTTLTGAQRLTNGSFQFAFTNSVGAVFGVLATTDLSLPLSNWTALGGVTEVSPGQFQFTDPQTTNFGERFYRIRSP